MKTAVFLVVALCSLIQIYPNDGGSKHLRNVGKLQPSTTTQKQAIFIFAAVRT
jgi:hypothetical protein